MLLFLDWLDAVMLFDAFREADATTRRALLQWWLWQGCPGDECGLQLRFDRW
ncbi:hypothetical protein [Haloarchaeobius sp. DFWS5]|uniref:hypothetical protein n=1 Tax=Haloarchaeobius sp. DFWS5 TaxID=3446114 RepID=UPI003EBBD5B9